MIFSPMTVADLDEVMEIERRSFPAPWSRGLFLHELKVPFSTTILARADEDPHLLLGYVCWWLVGDEIQILNVAVDPAQRQQGAGRTLVALVMQEAAEKPVRTVTLEVRRDNAAAIALYRSFGFAETGARRHYYGRGEDALVMTWTRPAHAADVAGEG
jgi:ribosomal-protein-alanine N-acetyltransferase